MSWFRRYRQFFSAFSSSTSKYFSSIGRCHSFSKTVFVFSLSFRWLKCSFTHCLISLKICVVFIFWWFSKTGGKYTKSFYFDKPYLKIFFYCQNFKIHC